MDHSKERNVIIWVVVIVVVVWAIIYYVTPSKKERIQEETIQALTKPADYPPPTQAQKDEVLKALGEKI